MGRYEGIKTKIIIPKSTDELGQGQAVGLGLVAVADSILMFAKAHLLIRGSLKKDELNAGVVQWLEDFERAFAHIREWAERSAAVREWKPGSWGAHAVVTMQDEARETIVGEDAPGGVG